MENSLLLQAAKTKPAPHDAETVAALLADGVRWERLLWKGLQHGVLALMWHNLRSVGQLHRVPPPVQMVLGSFAIGLEERNRLMLHEASELSRALRADGVRAICLKGPVLAALSYPSIGLRHFEDIDLLIHEDQLPRAKAILRQLGYAQGAYDRATGCISPVSRDEEIRRRLYSHETVEHFKHLGKPQCAAIEIDINFRLRWREVAPGEPDSDLRQWLEHAEWIETAYLSAYIFEHHYHILHLCAHLYSESCFFLFNRSHPSASDLRLFRICDIRAVVSSQPVCWPALCELARRYGMMDALRYAVTALATVYPDAVSAEADSCVQPNPSVLDRFFVPERAPELWQAPFCARLLDFDLRADELHARGFVE